MSRAQPQAVLVSLPNLSLEDDRRQPPGGCVSIATVAAGAGFDVEVCDLAGVASEQLADHVPEADVYGIATYTANYHLAQQLAVELRRRQPRALLVAGGPHATAAPRETARDFDCVVCGEAEYAFTSVLTGVADGKGRDIPRIILADPIPDINTLPFPDLERFCDMGSYSRRLGREPVICLDSSRGCGWSCRFCNSIVAGRRQWRPRTPESVAAEVQHHWQRGWRALRWNDDNFLGDRQRALAICDRLPPGISFRIFARAESLCDRHLCERLRAAGCVHVGVGIESLAPAMLALMGKATSVDRIIEGVGTARAAGLTVRGFFIVGFPGETDETVAETLCRLDEVPLDEAYVYPCVPYPGTDLHSRPGAYGIVWIDPDYSKYIQVGRNRTAGFVMRTTAFGPAEMRRWRDRLMERLQSLGTSWSDERGPVV